MKKPPRSKKRSLIDQTVLFRGYAYLGVLNSVFVMLAYFWVLFRGGWQFGMRLENSDTTFTNPLHLKATTIVFAGIVILQIANLLSTRSESRTVFQVGFFSNKLIFWGIGFALAFTAVLIYVPVFQEIFNTTALGMKEWAVLLLFSGLMFAIEEFRKLLWQRIGLFQRKPRHSRHKAL